MLSHHLQKAKTIDEYIDAIVEDSCFSSNTINSIEKSTDSLNTSIEKSSNMDIDSGDNIILQPQRQKSLFMTAGGKLIAPPSKDAIERGKKLLSFNDDTVKVLSSFSTASGRKVLAPSNEIMQKVKNMFESPIQKQNNLPAPNPSLRIDELKKKKVYFDLRHPSNRLNIINLQKRPSPIEIFIDEKSLKLVINTFRSVTKSPLDWIENHSKYIIWKYLSIYSKYFYTTTPPPPSPPSLEEYLSNNLLLRYEREVQQANRSIIKMISEGDASPSLSLCLLILNIKEDYLYLSDGWYSIKVSWNAALRRRNFKVGQKVLIISARHSEGIPSPPLLGRVVLSLDSNSIFTSPKWTYEKLGRSHHKMFNTSPSIDGGLMSLMEFNIIRVMGFRYRLYPQGDSSSSSSIIIDQSTYSMIERGSIEAPFPPSKVVLIVSFRVANHPFNTVTIWNYKDDPSLIPSLSKVIISFLKPFNESSLHSTSATRVFPLTFATTNIENTTLCYQSTPINGILDCCASLIGLSEAAAGIEKYYLWIYANNLITSISIPSSILSIVKKISLYQRILLLDLLYQFHDHKREILLLEFRGDSQLILNQKTISSIDAGAGAGGESSLPAIRNHLLERILFSKGDLLTNRK